MRFNPRGTDSLVNWLRTAVRRNEARFRIVIGLRTVLADPAANTGDILAIGPGALVAVTVLQTEPRALPRDQAPLNRPAAEACRQEAPEANAGSAWIVPPPVPVSAAGDERADCFRQGLDKLWTDLVAHPFPHHRGRIAAHQDDALFIA
jgi:hypothetical protein